MATTSVDTIVDIEDVTIIEGPASLDANAPLRPDEAKKVYSLIEERASNRKSGRVDVLVMLEEWATAEKYDIRDSQVLLVGRVTDYSEKAYYLEGAFEVDMDEMRSRDDIHDGWLTDLSERVDDTDDGAEKKGECYLPKSAVQGIYEVHLDD